MIAQNMLHQTLSYVSLALITSIRLTISSTEQPSITATKLAENPP